ncbi:hypothetical protein HU200_042271 [Digitaria exilis]|uniref:F-box domain-containing protein n=1 Tax=Digitaria exilis TaxID=1010633 RepID=A0A835B5A7_9POAL|nr:hypothetical protein HU200_042271 [Digitaria exilis]
MEETATSTTSMQQERTGWSSLPADLLVDIVDLLPWSSHPRFAAVCKHWRSAVSPFYPGWLTPVLLNAVDIGCTNLRYYSPYHHKIFEVSSELETPNAKICCTRGRHLTLCQQNDDEITVAHVDLVTGVIRDSYPVDHDSFDFVIYDGERRRMFGISAVGVLQVVRAIQSDAGGWYRWEFSEFSPDEPKIIIASPMTSPVIHRGLLYLLGVDGRLAVYDDGRHEQGLVVLDKPKGFGGLDCDDCYLFESDEGELMAVLMGRRGAPVRVVKLNEQEMEWEEVESLQGRALFTGTPTTMMVKTNFEWMQNKIFVPRLHSWPESLQVYLEEREGELAFVPVSTAPVEQDGGGTREMGIWSCGLEPQPSSSSEFWETIKFYHSIWVDFSN